MSSRSHESQELVFQRRPFLVLKHPLKNTAYHSLPLYRSIGTPLLSRISLRKDGKVECKVNDSTTVEDCKDVKNEDLNEKVQPDILRELYAREELRFHSFESDTEKAFQSFSFLYGAAYKSYRETYPGRRWDLKSDARTFYDLTYFAGGAYGRILKYRDEIQSEDYADGVFKIPAFDPSKIRKRRKKLTEEEYFDKLFEYSVALFAEYLIHKDIQERWKVARTIRPNLPEEIVIPIFDCFKATIQKQKQNTPPERRVVPVLWMAKCDGTASDLILLKDDRSQELFEAVFQLCSLSLACTDLNIVWNHRDLHVGNVFYKGKPGNRSWMFGDFGMSCIQKPDLVDKKIYVEQFQKVYPYKIHEAGACSNPIHDHRMLMASLYGHYLAERLQQHTQFKTWLENLMGTYEETEHGEKLISDQLLDILDETPFFHNFYEQEIGNTHDNMFTNEDILRSLKPFYKSSEIDKILPMKF